MPILTESLAAPVYTLQVVANSASGCKSAASNNSKFGMSSSLDIPGPAYKFTDSVIHQVLKHYTLQVEKTLEIEKWNKNGTAKSNETS